MFFFSYLFVPLAFLIRFNLVVSKPLLLKSRSLKVLLSQQHEIEYASYSLRPATAVEFGKARFSRGDFSVKFIRVVLAQLSEVYLS